MTTIYGVYVDVDDDECGEAALLVEQFTTEVGAKRYIEDYPRLAHLASSDADGWLVRFWEKERDETIARDGAAAEGNLRHPPRYARESSGDQTAEERMALWRERMIQEAVGRIWQANQTVTRAKAAATRARNTRANVWIKRHFPKGSGFYVRPIEVRDSVLTYEDIRFEDVAESYLRGHNEG